MGPFVENAARDVARLRERVDGAIAAFGRLARRLGAAADDGAGGAGGADGDGVGPEELFGAAGLGGFVAAFRDAREHNQRRRLLEAKAKRQQEAEARNKATCLLYTSPSPRDQRGSRMPSSA